MVALCVEWFCLFSIYVYAYVKLLGVVGRKGKKKRKNDDEPKLLTTRDHLMLNVMFHFFYSSYTADTNMLAPIFFLHDIYIYICVCVCVCVCSCLNFAERKKEKRKKRNDVLAVFIDLETSWFFSFTWSSWQVHLKVFFFFLPSYTYA